MDQRQDWQGRAEAASALAAEEARGHAGGAGRAVQGAFAGYPAGRRRPQQYLDRASDTLARQLAPQADAEAGADRGAGGRRRDRPGRGAGAIAREGGGSSGACQDKRRRRGLQRPPQGQRCQSGRRCASGNPERHQPQGAPLGILLPGATARTGLALRRPGKRRCHGGRRNHRPRALRTRRGG